jgi:acyl-CoA thioester hydrolase
LENLTIYKNSVQAHEIDNLGHMNVQYYVKHCIDSYKLNFRINDLISNYENLENNLFLEKINIRYLNEQRLGTPFLINFYVSKIESEKIIVFQEMENLETTKISATFILVFKIKIQKELIKNKFESFLIEHPYKLKKVPLYGEIKGLLNIRDLKLDYFELQNYPKIFDTFCGLANAKNNFISKYLDASDYMGIVSAAVPNLLIKNNHSVFETNIGGAAVEYEFFFNKFVEPNTSIKLFSGLRNIKNKTYTWSHWLVDIENKKVLAIANSVIVAMDLKNRKSVQIPYKMKTSLEKIVLK